MPEIQVEGLVRDFGEQRALDDVSFVVEDGELFTLLGPSGCGKSTTLLSIAGFQSPDAGRIRVGDHVFVDRAARINVPAERRNLGIVFQSYAIWPHMTVFENLAFPLKVRKLGKREIRSQVLETLELIEMRQYEQRYPHQLSGGQQQRVALGRALVYSPTVLLLDEPFSNLDAKLRERARTWVKELQHTLGLTTIFVTHDQDEALSMSDRIVVMNAGRVLQVGTPEEVYRHPNDRFVAEFVGRVNLIDGAVASQVGLQVAGAAVTREMTIAVRPEAIEVDPTRNGSNTYEARVQTVAFLGDHYEYELQAGPLALTVQTSRRVVGDRVKVHIPPDACSVVGH